MNCGRCGQGIVSPDGELSPNTSGASSDLNEGPFPFPLESCELVTSVTQLVSFSIPNAERPRCSCQEIRNKEVEQIKGPRLTNQRYFLG